MTGTLRLILGDQLNASHSWFQHKHDDVHYLIAEIRQETDYVPHHGQKIYAFFMAMQQFAQALEKAGHKVIYLTLDDTLSYDSLVDLITSYCAKLNKTRFQYQQPDEYRLHQQLSLLKQNVDFDVECVDSEHFIVAHEALSQYFKPNTKHRMEHFYRKMRKATGYLMHGDDPEGGKWNYDHDNRQSFANDQIEQVPPTKILNNADESILTRIHNHNLTFIGELPEAISWPVNRKQARELLAYFCHYLLSRFGQFQDAMTYQADEKWGLYHSRVSFALNTKMLAPKEVIETAFQAYYQSDGEVSLAQIEGFVRQILGWREFVRGIYWANAEQYSELNFLHHDRKLPSYFWDGKTKMQCVSHCITQSLDNAYAHHIQRLMVIGNFCLLTGIHPDEVDEWYLSIYIDAIEWVEQPNTRGMSQFADGGLIASKPYISSGQYINKMSDYCQNCHYKVKRKTGLNACPFNSLYWSFMNRHARRFEKNPRMAMTYRTWSKMKHDQQDAILAQADHYLLHIETL